jgi:Cu(I)/Ag(I) efflux system membrane fusion protein
MVGVRHIIKRIEMFNQQKKILVGLVVLLAILAGGYTAWHPFDGAPRSQASSQAAQYTCPMHSFIIKDRPSTCPICAMELVKKGAATADTKELQQKSHVFLSPAQQVMANLEVVSVMYKPLFKEIRAAGTVTYDQSRVGKVSAWVAGRLERLHGLNEGATVVKGATVAELTTPELINAEEDYLAAWQEKQRAGADMAELDPASLLYRTRQRLRQLGFQDPQFRALEKSGRPTILVPLLAPVSGVIVEQQAREGAYLKIGDSLIVVADLSQVWVDLQVYEDEFPHIKVGQLVRLSSRAYPQQRFNGTVIQLAPALDPKTRTMRVHVAVPNQGQLLKPAMLVESVLQVPLGTELAVPADAVVTTGQRKLVWVQKEPGLFVPREVTTGVRYRDDIQILSGLRKDEAVASSGAYLIDAEVRLQSGTEPAAPSQPPPSSGQAPAREKPAGKGSLDMRDMKM